VGKNGLEIFCSRPGLGHEIGPESAIRPEDALLHPHGAHLLENACGLGLIGPENNGVDARLANDPQLALKFSVAGQELLLDHDGMSEPYRRTAEFFRRHSAIAVVDAQKSDALEADLGV